jgi:hypothetical protein
MTDESIEKIVVRSGWVSGVGMGEPLVKGGRATIIASVFSYSREICVAISDQFIAHCPHQTHVLLLFLCSYRMV